jgi:hypothetical protein
MSVEKSKAARKAFEACERAVSAAQELIAAEPARGLGTTVMTSGHYGQYFKCSECSGTGYEGWSFCAFCGCEIVRYDRREGPKTIMVQMVEDEKTVQPQAITMNMDKPKGKSARV